jgi:hypothetical protein
MPLFDKNSLDALKNKVAEEQTKAQKELSAEADAKARHAANRSEIIRQLRQMAPELVSAAKSLGIEGDKVEIKTGRFGRKTEIRWNFNYYYNGDSHWNSLFVNRDGQLLYNRINSIWESITNESDIDKDTDLRYLVDGLTRILDKSSKKCTAEQIVQKCYRKLIERRVQDPHSNSRCAIINSLSQEFE